MYEIFQKHKNHFDPIKIKIVVNRVFKAKHCDFRQNFFYKSIYNMMPCD